MDLSNNYDKIKQSNRVSSLYLPLIVVESEQICGRRLVSGSADVRDGAQILMSMLKTNPLDILSINTIPRFRFKYNDIKIEYPQNFPKRTKELFEHSGYNISEAPLPYPTSNIIQKVEDKSVAFSDSRGSGQSIMI